MQAASSLILLLLLHFLTHQATVEVCFVFVSSLREPSQDVVLSKEVGENYLTNITSFTARFK